MRTDGSGEFFKLRRSVNSTGGMLLNQRFDPDIVKGEKGIDILETVLRAHFGKNGSHMQINVVNDEVLRDAQKNPDKYRNMLVRVAGIRHFSLISKKVFRKTSYREQYKSQCKY